MVLTNCGRQLLLNYFVGKYVWEYIGERAKSEN